MLAYQAVAMFKKRYLSRNLLREVGYGLMLLSVVLSWLVVLALIEGIPGDVGWSLLTVLLCILGSGFVFVVIAGLADQVQATPSESWGPINEKDTSEHDPRWVDHWENLMRRPTR